MVGNVSKLHRDELNRIVDDALHCMQLRLEQSGATPARLQHPADLVATVKCTGRLPALSSVVNEGQCQSFKNSPAFDAFVNKWNEFGDQYGLWPSFAVLDEPANRWTISVMAYLQDWRQVPGWETADGRFAAVFNHFKRRLWPRRHRPVHARGVASVHAAGAAQL
jgi:hypothetical protein